MLWCRSRSNSDRRSLICLIVSGWFAGFVAERECATRFRFIVLLLGHRNGLRRVADLYAERAAGGCDAEVLVAEATDEIKRLVDRLLLRKPKRVGLDLPFDRSADLRRCAEESIRGDRTVDALVRPLKVVVLHEELYPSKTVREVRKHRLAKKLLPQRLPESFDLPERLGMLRPTFAMSDAAPSE